MRTVILPEVVDCFLELASILYEKEYLGFEESAIQYTKDLFEDIKNNLPNKQKKVAPKYFDRYGTDMFYAFYKRNRNTSWYVFFNIYHTKGETVYFVRFVSNNHSIAQYL
jgi:hypothetical protein